MFLALFLALLLGMLAAMGDGRWAIFSPCLSIPAGYPTAPFRPVPAHSAPKRAWNHSSSPLPRLQYYSLLPRNSTNNVCRCTSTKYCLCDDWFASSQPTDGSNSCDGWLIRGDAASRNAIPITDPGSYIAGLLDRTCRQVMLRSAYTLTDGMLSSRKDVLGLKSGVDYLRRYPC